jgi:MerR family copper efflux transcriptional regulator
MDGLTIGKVARGAGLAIDTVRYYEREGLLEKPARTAAGYRQYTAGAVARLRFIRQAKDLGFTLPRSGCLR